MVSKKFMEMEYEYVYIAGIIMKTRVPGAGIPINYIFTISLTCPETDGFNTIYATAPRVPRCEPIRIYWLSE